MGLSKKVHFSEEEQELAAFAKAISHPARIAILQYLQKNNECICGDIVEILPLSQSTVSQHLKELKKVGLLKGSTEGASICYCINPVAWKKAEGMFKLFFEKLENCNDKCC